LTGVGGLWVGSTVSLARPLDPVNITDAGLVAPTPIKGAREDIKGLLKQLGYAGDFQMIAAVKDESLGRRYYHIRVKPQQQSELRAQLAKGWTWGRMNRAVYTQDSVSSKLPKNRNLPGWWKKYDTETADHMMLEHRGQPSWYVVFGGAGDVCLMWTGK
jgi:hypothetical protein